MVKESGIYKMYFKPKPDDFYIGSAINLSERKIRHKYQLKNDKHRNIILQRYCKKYGIENLVFIVVETCELSALIEREQYYIDNLDPTLNILKHAGNCLGYKHTEEAKQRISEANKGRKMTEEQILKGVISRRGQRTQRGCKRSEDFKLRLKYAKQKPIVNISTGETLDSISDLAELLGMKYSTLYAQIVGTNNNRVGWRFL